MIAVQTVLCCHLMSVLLASQKMRLKSQRQKGTTKDRVRRLKQVTAARVVCFLKRESVCEDRRQQYVGILGEVEQTEDLKEEPQSEGLELEQLMQQTTAAGTVLVLADQQQEEGRADDSASVDDSSDLENQIRLLYFQVRATDASCAEEQVSLMRVFVGAKIFCGVWYVWNV